MALVKMRLKRWCEESERRNRAGSDVGRDPRSGTRGPRVGVVNVHGTIGQGDEKGSSPAVSGPPATPPGSPALHPSRPSNLIDNAVVHGHHAFLARGSSP